MIDLGTQLEPIIGQQESESLAYKAVLPPSKVIAQLICSFANTVGGYIILGISENSLGIEIKGLSEDFQATSITHKAIDLLSPRPDVDFQYFAHKGKKLFAIKIAKSDNIIQLENKIYKRVGPKTILENPETFQFVKGGFEKLPIYSEQLRIMDISCTSSKHKFIEHYQGVLKIIDDLSSKLYPESPIKTTNIHEGKILSRILFSSCVDNFETYLSDLLFEIYLAKPETLKSKQEVTVEEVLNCSDIQDFVRYYAKQKLHKLQKGSVKGFIKENRQISDLNIIDQTKQNEVEAILQIRHLYSHRNGIVDEKFQHYFPNFPLSSEHAMSVTEIMEKLVYLVNIVDSLDNEAIKKYSLVVV